MGISAKSTSKSWFVLTPRGERGPYTTTDLKRFAWQGHIRRATQVRLEDGQWFEADRVEGLWDIRWRRPNGELVADGEAATSDKYDSGSTAGMNRIFSLLEAAKTWLKRPSVLLTGTAPEPEAIASGLRHV